MKRDSSEGSMENIGEAVGGTVGRAVGRANDMVMSTAASALGFAVEMLGDWWATPEADRAATSFGEAEARACREHHVNRSSQTAAVSPSDFDSARPVYQFGHMAARNPAYQASSFDRVEAELEAAWNSAGRDRFGEWSKVRDQVSFGYTNGGR